MHKIVYTFLLFFAYSSNMAQSSNDKYIDWLMKSEEADLLAEIYGEISPGVKEDRALMRHIRITADIIEDMKKRVTIGLHALSASELTSTELNKEKINLKNFIMSADELITSITLDLARILENISRLKTKKILLVEESYHILDMTKKILQMHDSIKMLAENILTLLRLSQKELGRDSEL